MKYVGMPQTHRVRTRASVCSLVGGAALLAATWGQISSASASETCFGFFELRGEVPYAVAGETWTFENLEADSLEGWTPMHPHGPDEYPVVRRQVLADFASDGLPAGAPIIDGDGMIWAGLHADEADSACFECGLGFGGPWSQQLMSPWIPYTGGNAELSFQYYLDTGDNADLYYRVVGSPPYYDGVSSGFIEDGPESWDDPALFEDHLHSLEFGDIDSVRVIFAIRSSSISDWDCGYDSEFGAFGVDNLVLTGGLSASYDFESASPGWENAIYASPAGLHATARDLAAYGEGWENLSCGLEGNVLAFHDRPDGFNTDQGLHGYSFQEAAASPIVDIASLQLQTLTTAELSFDVLSDYATTAPGLRFSVFVRTAEESCAITDDFDWTKWTAVLYEWTPHYECGRRDVDLLTGIDGVPAVLQARLGVYVCQCCCAKPEVCCDLTNQTPLFDNIQICIDGESSVGVEDYSPSASSDWSIKVAGNPIRRSSVVELDLMAGKAVDVSLYDVEGRFIGAIYRGLSNGEGVYPIGEWVERARQSGKLGPKLGSLFLRVEVEGVVRSERIVID